MRKFKSLKDRNWEIEKIGRWETVKRWKREEGRGTRDEGKEIRGQKSEIKKIEGEKIRG